MACGNSTEKPGAIAAQNGQLSASEGNDTIINTGDALSMLLSKDQCLIDIKKDNVTVVSFEQNGFLNVVVYFPRSNIDAEMSDFINIILENEVNLWKKYSNGEIGLPLFLAADKDGSILSKCVSPEDIAFSDLGFSFITFKDDGTFGAQFDPTERAKPYAEAYIKIIQENPHKEPKFSAESAIEAGMDEADAKKMELLEGQIISNEDYSLVDDNLKSLIWLSNQKWPYFSDWKTSWGILISNIAQKDYHNKWDCSFYDICLSFLTPAQIVWIPNDNELNKILNSKAEFELLIQECENTTNAKQFRQSGYSIILLDETGRRIFVEFIRWDDKTKDFERFREWYNGYSIPK